MTSLRAQGFLRKAIGEFMYPSQLFKDSCIRTAPSERECAVNMNSP